MTAPQPPTVDDADVMQELMTFGVEFGCHQLPNEPTAAYGLRLLDYIAEMASELDGVQSRIRELLKSE